MQTIQNAIKAGLDVLNAVEPIGPEHGPEVLAEQIELMKSTRPIQTGVMKRINVPGTPFEGTGEPYELPACPDRRGAVPGARGRGAAAVDRPPRAHAHLLRLWLQPRTTAETGVNPRDTAADTSAHRGMDLTDCRTMLYEAGFTHLCKGDGTLVELTEEYIK